MAEANAFFGHGGWSYQVEDMTCRNAEQSGDKWHIGYSCRVIVTVGDVERQGLGFGQGHAKGEGDAHESAIKEAETDALKRALRSFGWRFGLALYDKTKANVGAQLTPIQMLASEEFERKFNRVPNERELAVATSDVIKAKVADYRSEKGLDDFYRKYSGDFAFVQHNAGNSYGELIAYIKECKASIGDPEAANGFAAGQG
jgi:recombination DNA repair RAD52 pathway protein